MEQKEVLEDIHRISSLLDTRFKGPFGVRFGLDGLIGLIPGVGDLITTLTSLYIIFLAARAGAPPSLLLRMLLNVFFDFLIEAVPFIGNIFDFFWRSNKRNLDLLNRYLKRPRPTIVNSRFILLIFFVSTLLLLCATIYLGFKTLQWLVVFVQNLF